MCHMSYKLIHPVQRLMTERTPFKIPISAFSVSDVSYNMHATEFFVMHTNNIINVIVFLVTIEHTYARTLCCVLNESNNIQVAFMVALH